MVQHDSSCVTRRLVVADAITLMKSSVPYRRRNNMYNIKISDVLQVRSCRKKRTLHRAHSCSLLYSCFSSLGEQEVGGCMLQLVEGSRDKEGRVVLLVQPQNYTPAASPPLNVVRAVMYLLDKYVGLPPAEALARSRAFFSQSPRGCRSAAKGLYRSGGWHRLEVFQLRPQDAARSARRHHLTIPRYDALTQDIVCIYLTPIHPSLVQLASAIRSSPTCPGSSASCGPVRGPHLSPRRRTAPASSHLSLSRVRARAVIRPLLSEKLAERFHIVTVDRVSEFIPRERLLPTYGGTLHYDHRAWIRLQHEREGVPFSS